MSLSLPASSQRSFGLPLDTCCMESVFGTCDDGIWSHSWKRPTRRPLESVWWKRGSFHGVPWTAQFWMRGWWSVSTSGYGCGGMHRLTVTTAGIGTPWTLDQVVSVLIMGDGW